MVYAISPASPFRGAFPQSSLSVPDSVHRDIRYEIIRGKLQPVEHFHFHGLPPPLTGKAGYNPLHGFDAGPLPPGWGPSSIEVGLGGVDFSKLGMSYNLAVSSGGGADGESSGARGSAQTSNPPPTTSLPPTALNTSSATPQQSQASNSEPTTSNNSSSAPQEPPTPTPQPSTSSTSSAAPQKTPASGSESTSSERESDEAADGDDTRGALT
jgi:hypothetical protein